MYGFTDASCLWYIRVREDLAKVNVKKSKFDEAIFYYHKNNNLEGITLTYVDGVFWGCTQIFQENVLGCTGCPKIKVSIKNFNSDLLITLLHSFLISLDSVDL